MSTLYTQTTSIACAGLLIVLASTCASADPRCDQLVALQKKYEGAQLTSAEEAIKVKLVAWYKVNCSNTRSAQRAADVQN